MTSQVQGNLFININLIIQLGFQIDGYFITCIQCLHCCFTGTQMNPCQSNITIHILLNLLHTYPWVQIRRICQIIKTYWVGDHFLYSQALSE